jgi:thymidylate synthase (FAD)
MQAIYQGHYLDDQAVANFARLSFAKLAENFTPEQNHNLIRFLARGMASGDWQNLIDKLTTVGTRDEAHDLLVYVRKIPEHWVPFGHPHISIMMEAPVPIARQLFKHKIGMIESEESRRYISGRPVLYIPDEFRAAAANVKQGSGGIHPQSAVWRERYISHCNHSITHYEAMIDDGIAPEQARFILPQGVEVHWALTGSLYAWANLYNQRSEGHAQKETQLIAAQVDKIIAPLFPVSWAALTRGEY